MSEASLHRYAASRGNPFVPSHGGPAGVDPYDECEADLADAQAEIGRLRTTLAAAYDRIELQDLMLREVDHRAKNAFLSTAGLLQLQAAMAGDPLIAGPLLAARTRLLALAAAHAALTDLANADTLSLDQLIRAVCENVSKGIAHVAGDGRDGVRLVLELAPIQCRAVHAMPLALLASEALTNALKHAFPDGRDGTVRVRLWTGDRAVMLSVTDDGVGPPAQVHDGQGGGLMKRVARHLRADLSVIKPPLGGLEVRMSLNIPGFAPQ